MVLFYTLIFSLVLFFVISMKYVNVSHPLFLYIFLMTFTIFGYSLTDFPSLQMDTIIIYFSTIFSFVCGYISFLFLYICILNKQYGISKIENVNFSIKFYGFIAFLYIAVIIGMALQGIENANSVNTGSFFLDLRVSHIKNPAKFGLYPHMVLFLQSFFLLIYFSSKRNIKKIIFLFLFISIYGSFWKMERTGMIMSITAMTLSIILKHHFILNKKINYYSIFFYLILTISIFLIITISRSSVSFVHALHSLTEYMFKGLYTFDRYVLPYEAYGDYKYYFGSIGEKIISYIHPSNNLDIYVENLFTVYSYLAGPYIFGGRYLLYITFYLIGIFYSFLYSKVLQKNIYFMVYYSFFSFNIVMSFFSYIYSWNHWIYFAIILLLLRKMSLQKKDCN